MAGARFGRVGTLMLASAVLSGCAGGTSQSGVAPVGAAQAKSPVVWTRAPEPTQAGEGGGVDVVVAEIRSAPAACGLPEHHLTAFRGRQGGTETLLQVDEGYGGTMPPVSPVPVDLLGDGALDLVGVLSCTAEDTPLPDQLVVYTGPATPVAAFDLSRVQSQKFAVVRELSVVGGQVRVHWTAFDSASGPVTQYEGTVAWRGGGPVVEHVRRSGGPRAVRVESGTFMTGDGNVHCVMQPEAAWCDVLETTWTPPPSPPATTVSPQRTPTGTTPVPSAGATPSTATAPSTAATTSGLPTQGCGTRPYGRTFVIADGRARRACAGEQGVEIAALGSPLTAWHRQGWDATVMIDGRRSAALTPGSSMGTSTVRCSATSSTVTCRDSRTRAAFTVGRTTARLQGG